MKNVKNFFSKHHLPLQTLSCMALAFATVAANSRCAYIYHDPQKPDALKQLKKF